QRAEQLAAALPGERTRLEQAEQEREAGVQARHTAEARRTEVERRLADAKLESGRLEGDLALAAERLRNAGQRRATAAQRREPAERGRGLADRCRERARREEPEWAATAQVGRRAEQAAALGRAAAQAAAGLEQARRRVAELKEQETHGRAARRQAEEALAQVTARHDALAELERERVGLAPAAQALLKAREQFGDAVIGPLSDFVRTTRRDAGGRSSAAPSWKRSRRRCERRRRAGAVPRRRWSARSPSSPRPRPRSRQRAPRRSGPASRSSKQARRRTTPSVPPPTPSARQPRRPRRSSGCRP